MIMDNLQRRREEEESRRKKRGDGRLESLPHLDGDALGLSSRDGDAGAVAVRAVPRDAAVRIRGSGVKWPTGIFTGRGGRGFRSYGATRSAGTRAGV